MDRLLRIVTPEGGTQPEFHFYAARPKGVARLMLPLSAGDARSFLLSDEAWAYEVDVFELAPRLAPAEVPGALLRGLESLVVQGACLAWLMFDGAFDGVPSLATDWGAQNTYGIAGPALPPRLAPGEEDRKQAEWRETIRGAVEGFSVRQ